MASTTAIAAGTAAANSSLITVAAGSSIQVFTSADPHLGANEEVSVEQTPDDGTTWFPVSDPRWGGRFIDQNITRNMLTGPGDFRLVKSATQSSIAVYYDS